MENEKELVTEYFDPLDLVPIALASAVVAFCMILFKFIIKKLSMNNTNKGKHLPELSKLVRNISGIPDVVCYLTNDNELTAHMYGTNELYISKKLYDILDERERIAIMLHEVAHYANKSSSSDKIILPFQALSFVAFFLGWVNKNTRTLVVSFIFGELLSYIGLSIDRMHEYLSDSYATNLGYGPELKSVLIKINKHHINTLCRDLKDEKNGKIICMNRAARIGLFDDFGNEHPNLYKRIQAIELNIKKQDLFYTRKVVTGEQTNLPKPILYKKSGIEIFRIYWKHRKQISKVGVGKEARINTILFSDIGKK